MKIRRFIADFIDFWLCFIPGFCLSILLQPKPYVYADSINFIILYMPFLLIYFLSIFKDVIWGYKSFGKRIMKLNIYDRNNQVVISKRTLICRNIVSFWVFPLNVFLIFFRNKTFGDYILNTQVLNEEQNI